MPDGRRLHANAPPSPKQAVVVVHGMGEQRPLETLREFVEAVYQRDTTLTSDPRDRDTDADGRTINRVWIVPDSSTGSKELRRITTSGDADGRRTDFYELYWADVMNGTPLEMVAAWFRGLLLRSPFNIPARPQVIIAWLMLWALAIVFVIGAYLLTNPNGGWFRDAAEGGGGWLTQHRWWIGGILILGGLAVLALRLRRDWAKTKFLLPSALFAAGAAVVLLASIGALGSSQFWAGLIMAMSAAATAAFIVPYVGDVVRFVRATPGTVKDRAEIRERGLKLLKELHTKGLDEKGEGTREYDRIVVAAHSLGCLVAYDLLQHYWEEVGPTYRNIKEPGEPLATALKAVNKFVEDQFHGRPFKLTAYRTAQHRLHQELAASSNASWLISDFVTMGSPIVHAQFLLTDNAAQLERRLRERMFSASPPRPDDPNSSMLIYIGGKGPFVHHAAMFAAMRWTNLSDEHWFPLCGDVVSGKVPAVFGPGVTEVPLQIRRRSWWPRFVTHTEYWRNADPTWGVVSRQIVELRKALDL